MAGQNTRTVIVKFPFDDADPLICPECFHKASSKSNQFVYSGHAPLSQHIRRHHEGWVLRIGYRFCDFMGVSKYPMKDVKAHVSKAHPESADGPVTAARRSSTEPARTSIIVKGFGRGSKSLDIPTANFPQDLVDGLPQDFKIGIYNGWAAVEGQIYKMVMSIGWNPFYKNEKKSMEVHMLHNFDNDLY
ncbi:hypothetical protein PV325_011856, partial [Microctonus aethiopoides]